MKKMLPVFFAALVGLASCSKSNNPAPQTPQLEAKWQGLTTVETNAGPGGLVTTHTYPSGSYYLEFTPTEVLVYQGATVSNRFTYSRTGNRIEPSPGTSGEPLEIKELTSSRLVVLTYIYSGGIVDRTLSTTYSR
jgi:hypothetical protein